MAAKSGLLPGWPPSACSSTQPVVASGKASPPCQLEPVQWPSGVNDVGAARADIALAIAELPDRRRDFPTLWQIGDEFRRHRLGPARAGRDRPSAAARPNQNSPFISISDWVATVDDERASQFVAITGASKACIKATGCVRRCNRYKLRRCTSPATMTCPLSSSITPMGGPNIVRSSVPVAVSTPVAERFGIEPHDILAPVVAILGVDGDLGWLAPRRLTIRRGKHDRTMQVLEAPARVAQFGGQPIEQGGMRGQRSQAAEIGRRGHDAAAEVMHPHSIGDHPRRQRVVGSGQPAGKRQPAAGGRQLRALGGKFGPPTFRRADRQRSRSNRLHRLAIVAAMKQLRLGNMRRRLGEHAQEFFRRFFGPDGADAFVEFLEIVGRRLVVLIQHAFRDVDAGMLIEQLLLRVAAFVGGRLIGGPQFAAQRFFVFGQFLVERLGHVGGLLHRAFGGDFLRLGFNLGRLLAIGRRVQRYLPLVRVDFHACQSSAGSNTARNA